MSKDVYEKLLNEISAEFKRDKKCLNIIIIYLQ
jgi:hypothetical protein